MKPKSISFLEKFWSDAIGHPVDDLQKENVRVVPHGDLAGYEGAIAFKKNNSCLISVPQQLVEDITAEVLKSNSKKSIDVAYLETIFGDMVERSVGPAWIGKIDLSNFKPCHEDDSRELDQADQADFEGFLKSCADLDVEYSALKAGRLPTACVFVNGQIVAAAGYESQDGLLAHIGVLTHPDYRGKGYAKKAVSHITSIALDKNIGIQYRTLKSNTASVELARRLGFTTFAETIAVRFKQ